MTAIPTFSVRVKPEHQDLIRGVARLLKDQPEQIEGLRLFLAGREENTPVTQSQYERLQGRIQGLEGQIGELAGKFQAWEQSQAVPAAPVKQNNTNVLQADELPTQEEELAEVEQEQPPHSNDETQGNTDVLQDTKQPTTPDKVSELLALLGEMKGREMNLETMAVELNQAMWRTIKGAEWSKSNLSGWWKRQRDVL